MKKIFTIILSVLLIQNSYAVVKVPTLANSNGTVSCEINSESDYFPVGDTRGNNVLAKREIVRECQLTITEQGACKKWEVKEEKRSLSPSQYNAYESKNYTDSLGSLLAALGAYDQIEHLWSGWKGYCEIGTKSDFSWAEDPMFWASMAASLIMSGTESPDSFLTGTSAEAATTSAATATGETFSQVAEFAGKDFTENMTEEAAKQFFNNVGRCMIASGFEAASNLYEFYSEDDGGNSQCDPVDEICQEGAEATEESEIMTMDEVQFNDLVNEFASQEPTENIYDFVYVIPPSPENGIVSFRMKHSNEVPNVSNFSSEEMEKLKNKMKEMKVLIAMGVTAVKLAACTTGTTTASISPSSASEDDRASIRQASGAVIDFAAKFMGPYGPIIAAVLKIALYVATSYKSIDSCHDEDDAKEIGLRHERTQKSLKFNLCHLTSIECAEYSMLVGKLGQNTCVLDGYNYCCYDQIMSKILVEQLKAQLGRDWTHCTGINIRDLNYVSFQQCSISEMTDPLTFDGAHQMYKPSVATTHTSMSEEAPAPVDTTHIDQNDPRNAFQYKYHCIDLTEFLQYLNAQMGGEISMEDFEQYWNDITEQDVNQGGNF